LERRILSDAQSGVPQQRLNFFLLPHGHGALRGTSTGV
jgi:hypothetical protein